MKYFRAGHKTVVAAAVTQHWPLSTLTHFVACEIYYAMATGYSSRSAPPTQRPSAHLDRGVLGSLVALLVLVLTEFGLRICSF